MSENIEDIKNKIIYRSLYRGSKEMDILISNFVKSIINELDYNELFILDEFVNFDDELLKILKKNKLSSNIKPKFKFILEKFQNF